MGEEERVPVDRVAQRESRAEPDSDVVGVDADASGDAYLKPKVEVVCSSRLRNIARQQWHDVQSASGSVVACPWS